MSCFSVECSKLPGKFCCSSVILESWYNYNEDAVYSYRFQTAMTTDLENVVALNDFVIYRKIICAVNIHRQVMELVFI